MTTIYLSLSAQVAISTFFMKSPVPLHLHPRPPRFLQNHSFIFLNSFSKPFFLLRINKFKKKYVIRQFYPVK